MRKLYSENQIKKLASKAGKKLYRHSMTISLYDDQMYYIRAELISTKPDAYTSTTLPNDASQIGNHPAFAQDGKPAVTGVTFLLTDIGIIHHEVVDGALAVKSKSCLWTKVLGINDTVTEL